MRVFNVVGARPNFMKIAPIHRAMNSNGNHYNARLIHTGQHYDERMSKLFFDDLELPVPDVYLGVGSGSHAEQTAKVMIEFEKVCLQERPDLVVVVGDVNSTMACSIVASKLRIPVAHVEAGLRSFDRSMPEEINRVVTDSLSDFLFVTEKSGQDNLRNEGVSGEKVHFVGNVMIDSLIHFLEKAEQSLIHDDLRLIRDEYVLVTLHRPSNVDNPQNFEKIIRVFEAIQKEKPIVFPIHPRTQKNIEQFGLGKRINRMENLKLIPPLGYLDFMSLQKHAFFVMTDSGGMQEETTYLGVPCLTLRENTERPVTAEMGTNEVVGTDADKIIAAARKILNHEWKEGQVPPLWDGHAAERIVEILAP